MVYDIARFGFLNLAFFPPGSLVFSFLCKGGLHYSLPYHMWHTSQFLGHHGLQSHFQHSPALQQGSVYNFLLQMSYIFFLVWVLRSMLQQDWLGFWFLNLAFFWPGCLGFSLLCKGGLCYSLPCHIWYSWLSTYLFSSAGRKYLLLLTEVSLNMLLSLSGMVCVFSKVDLSLDFWFQSFTGLTA